MSASASLRRLLGYHHAESLETHLYFTLCFLVSLSGLFALTINLALDHFLSDILISFAAVIAGGAFNLIGRRMESPERLGPAIILMVALAVGSTWFTNGGISGGSMGWFAPLIVISTVMLKGASRALTLTAVLAVILGCAAVEFVRPEMVGGHTNPDYAFFDVLSVFVATLIVLALVALLQTQAYRHERERAAELVESSIRNELELEQRKKEIEALRDLLPICANCHQIRDEQGIWHGLETYMQVHRSTDFSHGICPTCREELYDTK